MKLATLLLSGAVALGALASADVLAHDKGRGYDRGDHPRHEVHRYKHERRYDRDHRKNHWKGDRGYGKHHWKHDRPYWKRDHKAYWHHYRPYRHEYRYRPHHRDSWYGIHLFLGG